MKIRIQPRDIEVPQDDPFQNDLLNRRESVEVLTNIVRSIDGPFTLAVDAPWGAGKTTFIKIWTQVLRNEGFPLVSFNAWETDFSNDPFVALSEEITQGLQVHRDGPLRYKVNNLRKKASEVAIRAVPGVVRLATAGVLDINPLIEKEAGQILASYTKDRLAVHIESQKSLQSFKTTLQDTADTLSEQNNNLPLVVVIDELDRCRPSYAVDLLEVAKHLFSVDHIVFVLAVNRSELAHSVRALYGNSFDAPDYLKRFFDLDFRLSNPSREDFIKSALSSIQFDEYFIRTQDIEAKRDYEDIQGMLLSFLGNSELSIRTIGQAIQRLGLILASLRSDRRMFGPMAIVALVIRTVDFDLYQRFIKGETTDIELVDSIFRLTGNEHLREIHKYSNSGPLFESMVIHGCRELSKEYDDMRSQIESPLLEKYTTFLSERDENTENSNRYRYVKRVIDISNRMNEFGFGQPVSGFRHAIQRIELLSRDLLGDDPQ